jgi:hypothetical protein
LVSQITMYDLPKRQDARDEVDTANSRFSLAGYNYIIPND